MDSWAQQLDPDLRQGDVVDLLPIAVPKVPLRGTEPSGKDRVWREVELPAGAVYAERHLIVAATVRPALVLSHCCELEKQTKRKSNSRKPILIAPFVRLEDVGAGDREAIRQQRQWGAYYAGDVPGAGEGYFNLRGATAIDRSLVEQRKKLASMTDRARDGLKVRLIAFFTRIGADDLE